MWVTATTRSSWLLLSLWWLLGKIPSNCGAVIEVFSDYQYRSDKAGVNVSECSNLPSNLAGDVSSINTHNQCARLYSKRDCEGEAVEILAHSWGHGDLGAWNFDDKTHSVGPCLEECDGRVTGGTPTEPFNITCFDREHFKGAYADLKVDGCTLVPPRFKHRFRSVNVHGQCVKLWKNEACTSKYHRNEFRWDMIELRIGSPQHSMIASWTFSEVGAVSHCSYKCNNKTSGAIPSTGKDIPEGNEVFLYDAPNFRGNKGTFKLEGGSCLDVEGDWEGTAVAVKAAEGTCITLHDKRQCTGRDLSFQTKIEDLTDKHFDGVARSMQHCNAHSQISNLAWIAGRGVVLSPADITVIVGVLLLICAIIGGIIFQLVRRIEFERRLSEREIRDFLNGFGEVSDRSSSGRGINLISFESVEDIALNRPYNTRFEVKREQFSMECMIGMGQFGLVCRGTLKDEQERRTTVAVKTLKASAGVQDLRCLMKEVKVMLYISELGEHPNVVSVVGCCTEGLETSGDLFMLLEYCCNGSLDRFMKTNKKIFRDIILNGRVDWEQFKKCSRLTPKDSPSEKYFDIFLQLNWMLEVASGMEFLAVSKVVHRDLASRNILLDSNFVAKISDFGLSRKTYNYTSYLKKGNDPLPWQWLAIESLTNGTFSTKSDIWSYGVLCWEIFTLGEEPFATEVCGPEFISRISQGQRLAKPSHCIDECYQLMHHCWNEDPSCRPTFSEIALQIENLIKILQTSPVVPHKTFKPQPKKGYVESYVVKV